MLFFVTQIRHISSKMNAMQRQLDELKNEIQLFKVGTNTVLKYMDLELKKPGVNDRLRVIGLF